MASSLRLALVLAALLVPAVARAAEPSAADRETARTLMADGRAKRDANDLKTALRAFQAADALMHVPTTAYEVAKTESMLGMLVEARDEALQIARSPTKPGEPTPFADARAAAEKLADELEGRIPSIRVVVQNAPENVSVTIDDVTLPAVAVGLPRKLDPGPHAIVVKAGANEKRMNVEVLEREAKDVPIDFSATTATPLPEPHESAKGKGPWMALGITSVAIGGVGLALGAITGSMSLAQTNTIKDSCTGNTCPPVLKDGSSTASALSNAQTLATVSDVAFIAGGVLAAAGVAFIVVGSTSKKASMAMDLRLGPGSLMLAGRF